MHSTTAPTEIDGASRARIACWTAVIISAGWSATAWAQEGQQAKAQAPKDHVQLKDTASGAYFIAKPLKEQYDQLLARLSVLRTDIDAGRISGTEATRQLTALQTELEALRREIQNKLAYVPIAKTHTQTETMTFELGVERLLVITADHLRVVGWDQPGVKCELEKTVLSADDQVPDAELQAIQLVHKVGANPGIVGKPRAEWDAEEEKFNASEAGQAQTPEQRQARKKLVDSIRANYEIFESFQGRAIDAIHIDGLNGERGNRQMSLEVSSEGGGEWYRSVWRRHARVTVYVPACKTLAVRGALVGLDVQNVHADMVLTSQGSDNRDFYGEFAIRDLHGSLFVRDSPLHVVEGVDGNVQITSTRDFANSGTSYDGGSQPGQVLRLSHFSRALSSACKGIRGDFIAWFGRVDLQLEDIGGRIDVRNEFGDTRLILADKLASGAHRIVSEAGRVELEAPRSALGDLPIWAVTSFGNVRTNAPRDLLDLFQGTVGRDASGVSRGWLGFRRPRDPSAPPGGLDLLDSLERPSRAYHGENRSAGLDLISRGGSVAVNIR
jgi:hypothetical protein